MSCILGCVTRCRSASVQRRYNQFAVAASTHDSVRKIQRDKEKSFNQEVNNVEKIIECRRNVKDEAEKLFKVKEVEWNSRLETIERQKRQQQQQQQQHQQQTTPQSTRPSANVKADSKRESRPRTKARVSIESAVESTRGGGGRGGGGGGRGASPTLPPVDDDMKPTADHHASSLSISERSSRNSGNTLANWSAA